MSKRLSFVAFLVMASCSVGLEAPDDVIITCDSNAGCPTNYACDTAAGRCFDTRVSLPRVFIEPVARGYDDVPLTVTVADNDADTATVSGEYSIDGGDFVPASIDGAGLETTRAGVPHVVVWHAGADLGDNGYRPSVRLRLTASDRGGRGSPTTSESFAVGDNAPVVTSVSVDGSGALSGNIIVRYDVADDSADAVAVERLEVSYNGTFAESVVIFDAAAPDSSIIPSGALVGIESSPAGVAGSFTWYSEKSLVDAPRARLRLTLRDAFLSAAPVDSAPFYLRTQQPPRISALRSPAAAERTASGPLPFAYRLIDDDGENANVVFEYSLDGGASFKPCREYPVPESEGIFGLAAAAEVTGGIEHVFVWDPTGAGDSPSSRVVVRARADTPSDLGELVSITKGAGAPYLPPYDVRYSVSSVIGFAERYSVGDVDADGLPDVAVSQGSQSFIEYGCAPYPCFAGANFDNIASTIDALLLGDMNGDGGDDLLLAHGTAIDGRFTTVTSVAATIGDQTHVQELPSVPKALASGDFDGDGHADLAALLDDAVAVMFGDGLGGLTAPVSVTTKSAQAFSPSNLDGDDRRDLVVLYETGEVMGRLLATGDRSAPFVVMPTALGTIRGFIASADFDGDGLDDVLTSGGLSFGGDQFINAGGGNFTDPVDVPLTQTSVHNVMASDVDGDGRGDIILMTQVFTTASLRVLYNIGDARGAVIFDRGQDVTSFSNAGEELLGIGHLADGRGVMFAGDTSGLRAALAHVPSGIGNGALYTPTREYWNNGSQYAPTR